MHGAVVLVLLKDLRMLFHHFLFLLCVAFPAVVGHCWDSPGQPRGHRGQRGGLQSPLLPTSIPQAPQPAVCPSQVGTWLHFICLGNPKTAEMLVPRREEEPRVGDTMATMSQPLVILALGSRNRRITHSGLCQRRSSCPWAPGAFCGPLITPHGLTGL